tara:strand:- start:427 stop:1383 length:957 start_codon:yes stop_codon:yes gene_type:complete
MDLLLILMSKTYLFAIMLLFVPFTGCIEVEKLEDTPSLRSSVDKLYGFWRSDNTDYEGFCGIFVEPDGKLLNGSAKKECVDDMGDQEDYGYGTEGFEYKYSYSNYTQEEQIGYKGVVYEVIVDEKYCDRYNSTEPWDCNSDYEFSMLWALVDGKWAWAWYGLDDYVVMGSDISPTITFWVEEDSSGVYHVEVIKISEVQDLTGVSFFLKDDTGATYTGGNGFGEIAMQYKDGEEKGIDMNYGGDDGNLQSRATNVSNDDGSEFPVHFSDNDRDSMLSAGDKFLVYKTGNSANGPAESGWKLDIQFDASGEIIGSAKLL